MHYQLLLRAPHLHWGYLRTLQASLDPKVAVPLAFGQPQPDLRQPDLQILPLSMSRFAAIIAATVITVLVTEAIANVWQPTFSPFDC